MLFSATLLANAGFVFLYVLTILFVDMLFISMARDAVCNGVISWLKILKRNHPEISCKRIAYGMLIAMLLLYYTGIVAAVEIALPDAWKYVLLGFLITLFAFLRSTKVLVGVYCEKDGFTTYEGIKYELSKSGDIPDKTNCVIISIGGYFVWESI